MPYFKVLLHGTGTSVAFDAKQCMGFYTTRAVRASSAREAALRATELVTAEWARPPYSRANQASAPTLSIESVTRASFFGAMAVPRTGYTFYEANQIAA